MLSGLGPTHHDSTLSSQSDGRGTRGYLGAECYTLRKQTSLSLKVPSAVFSPQTEQRLEYLKPSAELVGHGFPEVWKLLGKNSLSGCFGYHLLQNVFL